MLGGEDSAISYMDSWAVMPTLTHALTSTQDKFWQKYDPYKEPHGWVDDPSTFFQCSRSSCDSSSSSRNPYSPGAVADSYTSSSVTSTSATDDTLYIEVFGEAFQLSGFYVRRGDSPESRVYSHVGALGQPPLFLFKKDDSWVIGEQVMGLEGLGYVMAPGVMSPADIGEDAVWHFIAAEDGAGGGGVSEWLPLQTVLLAGDETENLYSKLRRHRSISHLPEHSPHFTLRNGVAMPAIGEERAALRPVL